MEEERRTRRWGGFLGVAAALIFMAAVFWAPFHPEREVRTYAYVRGSADLEVSGDVRIAVPLDTLTYAWSRSRPNAPWYVNLRWSGAGGPCPLCDLYIRGAYDGSGALTGPRVEFRLARRPYFFTAQAGQCRVTITAIGPAEVRGAFECDEVPSLPIGNTETIDARGTFVATRATG